MTAVESFDAHREGAVVVSRALASDFACWRLRDGRIFLGTPDKGVVLAPGDLLDIEHDWRGAPSMAGGDVWSVFWRRGESGEQLFVESSSTSISTARACFDDMVRVASTAARLAGSGRYGDPDVPHTSPMLTERAFAWLREPPGGCAVIVVGPRFVIVRDGTEVQTYELPAIEPWGDRGISLDDVERAIGRVLWREKLDAVRELETSGGPVVVVPSLDESYIAALEAHVAANRTHTLVVTRLAPSAQFARAATVFETVFGEAIAFEPPGGYADRGKLAKVLADGDLVVAGRRAGRIVFA